MTVNEEHNSNLFFWFFPAEGTEHLYQEDQDYEYNEESERRSDQQHIKNKTLKNDSTSEDDDSRPVVLWLQGNTTLLTLY